MGDARPERQVSSGAGAHGGRLPARKLSVRTTLKRGLGRAAPNGNGKPVLPPGVTSPVSLYRQEAYGRSRMGRIGRVLAWLGIVALVFMVGSAGGAYLYFHESVAAVAAKTPAVKKAAKQLDIPLPGQPAVALVIGSDHRVAEGKGAASRSDTLMLLRADPQTDSISLLSFPRDMRVEIHCPGRTPYFDKIAHAYATCGPRGSLQTVKNLTNLDINYLITVDFLRVHRHRRPARWRMDRRRPALLQRPQRPVRVRQDRPQARVPEPDRAPGARLRALPAHGLRPLPRRPPAAVREGDQGADPGQLRPDGAAEDRSCDHEQRRGGAGRRQRRLREDGPLLRLLRVRPCRAATSSRRVSTGSRASPT